MPPDVLKILKELAAEETCDEKWDNPFCYGPFDWSGGNYDDCYSMGQDDGEILLARRLLEMLSDESA